MQLHKRTLKTPRFKTNRHTPDVGIQARAHVGDGRQSQQTGGGGHVAIRGQRVTQRVVGQHLDALRKQQLRGRKGPGHEEKTDELSIKK